LRERSGPATLASDRLTRALVTGGRVLIRIHRANSNLIAAKKRAFSAATDALWDAESFPRPAETFPAVGLFAGGAGNFLLGKFAQRPAKFPWAGESFPSARQSFPAAAWENFPRAPRLFFDPGNFARPAKKRCGRRKEVRFNDGRMAVR
jgi:hypothetical protein